MSIPGVGPIEMPLEPRRCELCGGADFEPLWSTESVVTRAVHTWRFPVRIALCRICGFCCVSPGPAREALARYHAEGLPGFKGIGLPYSIDARMRVLERFRNASGVFAEVGGDEPGEFHRRVARLFGRQIVVEVASASAAEYRSVHDLPECSVDVLAHYDVLEHVENVRGFLEACRRALKPGGIMVCEVPDLRLYPRNLLLLEFEHVNHFSSATLAAIAGMSGLELLEVEHRCSRPYGMGCVFRRVEAWSDRPPVLPFEYADALACVRGGIEQVRRTTAQIDILRQRVTDLGRRGARITLWAVTDLLRRFLEGVTLSDDTIVVDADPRRRDHLAPAGPLVHTPQECREHIATSDLLAIFAPRYAAEIVGSVARETGRSFAEADVVVIGTGPSGESLT